MRLCDPRGESRIRRFELDANELRVAHGLDTQLVEVSIDRSLAFALLRRAGSFLHSGQPGLPVEVLRPECRLLDQPEAIHDGLGYRPPAHDLNLRREIILAARVEAVDFLDGDDIEIGRASCRERV